MKMILETNLTILYPKRYPRITHVPISADHEPFRLPWLIIIPMLLLMAVPCEAKVRINEDGSETPCPLHAEVFVPVTRFDDTRILSVVYDTPLALFDDSITDTIARLEREIGELRREIGELREALKPPNWPKDWGIRQYEWNDTVNRYHGPLPLPEGK